jgi:hypothetical protein
VLRETITSAVQALGAGKIKPEEMPVSDDTRKNVIRYAPGFGRSTAAGDRPYTVDGLARFLGEVKSNGEAHEAFRAAFGALELISEGYLAESALKDFICSGRRSTSH